MGRVDFQIKYFEVAPHNTTSPQVLNIGSCDDPVHFGDYAMHVDIDDWSAVHKHFTKADAISLPFPDKSYHTVILGDILEHVVDPLAVTLEAARVCSDTLIATIFEEWRLPGHGQWIEEGQKLGDEASIALGYTDREDYQLKVYEGKVISADDDAIPHLIHINQFDDTDILKLVNAVAGVGFFPIETNKAFEVKHLDHDIYNWLLSFRRTEGVV